MFEDFKLKTFLEVAETGSFTAASKNLNVSQPAVSQNIADLEKTIGVKLFDRSKGEVTPTASGTALKKYAENIIYWYDAAEEMFGELGKATPSNRPIKIAASTIIAEHILPSALSSIKATTNTHFEISTTVNADLKLEEDSPHDAIIYTCNREDMINLSQSTSLLGMIQSVAFVSPMNKKAVDSKGEVNFSSLGKIPKGCTLYMWKDYLSSLPSDVLSKVSLSSDSSEFIKKMVSKSPDAIGVLPWNAVENDINLRLLPIPLPYLQRDVHIVAKKEFSHSLLFRFLKQELSDEL